MKIYNIQAKIIEVYREDISYITFGFYMKKEIAQKDMKKIKDKWSEFKTCFVTFSIKEIEVIE